MATEEFETVTLAFELSALRQFASPSRVLADARQWTRAIGVVSDEPTPVVRKFGREHGYRFDFFPGSKTKRDSLRSIITQPEHDADRYVLVAVDENLRELAEGLGWEFRPLAEAADTAGWPLATPVDDEDDEDTWF